MSSTIKKDRHYQAFRTAKSISKNIPASKFALAPRALHILERIEFLSAIAGKDLMQLLSTQRILQNRFETDVVMHLRRTLDPSQTAAIATADLAGASHDSEDVIIDE